MINLLKKIKTTLVIALSLTIALFLWYVTMLIIFMMSYNYYNPYNEVIFLFIILVMNLCIAGIKIYMTISISYNLISKLGKTLDARLKEDKELDKLETENKNGTRRD